MKKPPQRRQPLIVLPLAFLFLGMLAFLWWPPEVRLPGGDESDVARPVNGPDRRAAAEHDRGTSVPASPAVVTTPEPTLSVQSALPALARETIPLTLSLSAMPKEKVMTERMNSDQPDSRMNCERGDGGFRCGACSHSGECPAGQACVVNVETRLTECAGSECEDDQHCTPGTVCRVSDRTAAGMPVRRCLVSGDRGVGESCVPVPSSATRACREDLICIDGVCGQRCTPGVEGVCPPGSICRESLSGAVTGDGAGCVPDCRLSACVGGLRCVTIRPGVHQCLRMMVNECETDQDCPQAQRCLTEWFGTKGGRYCAAACEPWHTDSCPAGFVCGAGGPAGSSCYRECGGPNRCPVGFVCKTVTEDLQVWGCRVDYNN